MQSWRPPDTREGTIGNLLQVSPGLATDYFRLFVNRRAHTIQSNRPHPRSGKHYYYRPTRNKLGLTLETIRRHLEGEITISLYAINPVNQSCKWIAIDVDDGDAVADLIKLAHRLEQDGVDSALEQSNRGGHLWIFMAEPLLARDCRIYLFDLALRLGVPIKAGRQQEGIEVFPKHDALKPGRYGNAIRGPLGIHRGAAQRFWFCGADPNLEAQMSYLNLLPKVTCEQLARLIAGKSMRAQFCPAPKAESAIRGAPGGPEFRILDHINTPVHTVGHNKVTRCPSCAEEGHDTSGDNLSILIEDPRKYICWAGCTRDMIRAAVGCPRPVRHV